MAGILGQFQQQVVVPRIRMDLSALQELAGLQAYYDALTASSLTYTAATGLTSQWSDLSGLGHHLLQATGANQPIYLPWSGTNYVWFPGGSAGNYLSTPSSSALNITGDLELQFYGSIIDHFVSKSDNANQCTFDCFLNSGTRTINYQWYPTGAVGSAVVATSTAAVPYSAGQTFGMKITHDVDNGAGGNDIIFYTSADGVTWTKLGNTVTKAGTTSRFAGSASVNVGSRHSTLEDATGICYWCRMYNGIGGSLVMNCDASQTTDGSPSWTASTGEVWTVATSGGKPAMIVGRPGVLGDGSAFYMKAAPYTANQPVWRVIVCRILSWTSGDYLCDGNAANTAAIIQTTSTPQLNISAGSSVAANTGLAVGSIGIITAVLNGASSSLQINNAVATTGDAGAGNAGGFTLFAKSDGTALINAIVYGAADFNVMPSAADKQRVVKFFSRYWGISV
jgi:hypothetical protein